MQTHNNISPQFWADGGQAPACIVEQDLGCFALASVDVLGPLRGDESKDGWVSK